MPNVARRVKTNAAMMIAMSFVNPPIPKTITMDAPNDAAAEIPRVNGLARGFRSTPCITAPAIPSPNPAAMAKRIR